MQEDELWPITSTSKPAATLEHALGYGGGSGAPIQAETRAKISAAKTGHTTSAETRAKMSAAKTGRRLSDETRAKMSAA